MKTDDIMRYQQQNPAVIPENMDTRQSIYGLTREGLEEWFAQHGERPFRAHQVWDWLYRQRVQSFQEMTNLSEKTRELLDEHFQFNPLEVVKFQKAEDGTVKYLFRMNDHLLIETVLMYHEYGLSVCVTTQVGCNIGCTFCASGLIRKQRDLTAGEIVAQIMQIQHYLDEQDKNERVSHCVLMGIGEPFDNYDNILDFIRIINSDHGLAIGARHITVSTSGLAPKIREFADEDIQVNLAVSLHAPNNDVRTSMMRINAKYPIEELMDAIKYYMETTNRRVTFEYIMIEGVNDQPEHAQQLSDLLASKRRLSYVNLIPYNPVAGTNYQRSPAENIQKFHQILRDNKITATARREHGTEIDAACGQLRSNEMKRQHHKRTIRPRSNV